MILLSMIILITFDFCQFIIVVDIAKSLVIQLTLSSVFNEDI